MRSGLRTMKKRGIEGIEREKLDGKRKRDGEQNEMKGKCRNKKKLDMALF